MPNIPLLGKVLPKDSPVEEVRKLMRRIHEQNQNWLLSGITDEGGHDFIHENIPTLLSYIRSLEDQNKRLGAILKQVEWSASSFEYGECPVCAGLGKHESECELNEAITLIPR